MVAGAFVDEGTFGGFVLFPAVFVIVFFPGDEVEVGVFGEFGKGVGSEEGAVDDEGLGGGVFEG